MAEVILGALISNCIAVIVRLVYSHYRHQEQLDVLREIKDLLTPLKG